MVRNINTGEAVRPGFLFPLFLILLLLFPLSAVSADDPSGFLWGIDSPGGKREGFLAGSVHLLSEEDLPLPAKYEEAFAASELLAVEADVYGGKGLTELSPEILFDEEVPLAEKISPEVYRELVSQMTELGIPEPLVSGMRPWFAALVVIELKLSSLGFLPQLGVDMYFLERAYEKGMPVVELESVPEQLGLFRDMKAPLMAALLEDALMPMEEYAREVEGMIRFWKEGRDEELLGLLRAGSGEIPHIDELNRILIDERNRRMARKITELLGPDPILFIVVGAGHLVGEKGIPGLLEEAGFLLTRL